MLLSSLPSFFSLGPSCFFFTQTVQVQLLVAFHLHLLNRSAVNVLPLQTHHLVKLFHPIHFHLPIAFGSVLLAIPLSVLRHVVLLPHFLFRGPCLHQHLLAALQTTRQQKVLRHVDDDKLDAWEFFTNQVRIPKEVVNREGQNHILACFDSFLVLLNQEFEIRLPLLVFDVLAFLTRGHGLVQQLPYPLHLGIFARITLVAIDVMPSTSGQVVSQICFACAWSSHKP